MKPKKKSKIFEFTNPLNPNSSQPEPPAGNFFSRRSFLQAMGLGTAGLALPEFAQADDEVTAGNTDAARNVVVGDSEIRLRLRIDGAGLREDQIEISGQVFTPVAAAPWKLETDAGTIIPLRAALDTKKEKPTDRFASFKGVCDQLDWRLEYRIVGAGMVTKTLTLTPKRNLLLKQVWMWLGQSGVAPAVSSTRVQDIAAFFRQGDRGMFVSLDFPYSRIVTTGQETSVTYPPHDKLTSGQTYVCHSLTIGATRLKGRMRYGFDEGEVDAIDSYIQERFAPRFNRPMFIAGSINNRYTMCKPDLNDGVFYTMKDHPTLSFNPDILKREIELMSKLGIEYYQTWPGPFDSVPEDPDPKFVDDIVDFGRRRGVRIGDYSSTENLTCFHYNEHRVNPDTRPEWGLKRSDFCLGNPKFIKLYKDTVVSNDKRFHFDIHCFDGLNMQECNRTDHSHPTGRDSLYAKVRGLVELMDGVNNVSPQMISWSNMGEWAELLPKIAWTNPNLYLTDPYIESHWQGLNMTRLLDDVRREQMVSLHYKRFIPYRYLSNCQYFCCLNSIVPDIRNYQYGALSTIAVTPNLSLGEARPWIDRLTSDQQGQVIGFYKKWTEFLIKNYDLWKKTYQVGENPGMGSVEIYSHAKGNHGFIFLVNPQYWDRTVTVPLDEELGFSGNGRVEVVELHPVERLRLTDKGPLPTLGSRITVHIPAQAVIVLEIRPAPQQILEPRLYGLPGTIDAQNGGYRVKTWGQQGVTERCAVLLPKGSKPIASASVRDYPKQPLRWWAPTPIQLVASDSTGLAIDVTFRREAAPTELRMWKAHPGSLEKGLVEGWASGFSSETEMNFPLFVDIADDAINLPVWDADADRLGLGPLADFCGAYIDNAFSEIQETWINLKTGATAGGQNGSISAKELVTESRPLPEMAKDPTGSWWVATKFNLPFMYTIGSEPFFDEHTFLVLPFIRQGKVGQIKAWINGVALEVRKYKYPKNPNMSCFYADLVGSGAKGGENTLVICFGRQQ